MREPGQSTASADALAAWVRATDEVSVIHSEVGQLRRDLRAATKKLKEARDAVEAADRFYIATPWAEEQTA